jgi:ribulose-phosphate 3-epimerase
MKSSVSLWSADLVNLAADIRRVEPYSDEFHIDVADGRYAPMLLFFPDMVAAIRRQTKLALEVHLITEDAGRWVGPFIDAGADVITFYPDAAESPRTLVGEIRARGRRAGISLSLAQPVDLIDGIIDQLDRVVVMNTDVGIKGVDAPAPEAYEKIRRLVELRNRRRLWFTIEADGAIRRNTVPLLRDAGADMVVPGSLMFGNDPGEISRWLRSMQPHRGQNSVRG